MEFKTQESNRIQPPGRIVHLRRKKNMLIWILVQTDRQKHIFTFPHAGSALVYHQASKLWNQRQRWNKICNFFRLNCLTNFLYVLIVQVLTNFVTDQKLKDCLLQTVCYLTPLTEVRITIMTSCQIVCTKRAHCVSKILTPRRMRQKTRLIP